MSAPNALARPDVGHGGRSRRRLRLGGRLRGAQVAEHARLLGFAVIQDLSVYRAYMLPFDPFDLTSAQYSAAASWLSVGILGATLAVVYSQLKEAARLRWEQTRPYVVVSIVTRRQLAMIRVSNIGKTAARDVHLSFVGDEPKGVVTTIKWIGRGIWGPDGLPVLPPGHQLDFILDMMPRRVEANAPMSWTVSVNYADGHGRPVPAERFPLDLVPHLGALVPHSGVYEISKALQRIDKNVDRWTDGLNGLRVQVDIRQRTRDRERRPFRLTRVRRILGKLRPSAAAREFSNHWRGRRGWHPH